MLALLAVLTACGAGKPRLPEGGASSVKIGAPYRIKGRLYRPSYDPEYDRTGIASWYGGFFHGRPTANGERFDKNLMSAAHPTLPLPALVEVTNLENGRSTVLRVNDRGPFVDDRLIDVSEAAARHLGFREAGLARVRVRFVELADGLEPARSPEVKIASAAERIELPAPATSSRSSGGSLCGRSNGNFIQIGAFSKRANADRAAEQLDSVALVAVQPVRTSRGEFARVRLGPLASRRTALAVLPRIKRMGYPNAVVLAC